MVSLSTIITLGAIGTAVLGFYKLGGASGIGSRVGGGFSSLFDSFTSSLNPIQAAIDKNNAENPALNPTLVAQARFEEATTLDPNLAADRFVDPAGIYDPYTTVPTPIAPTPIAQHHKHKFQLFQDNLILFQHLFQNLHLLLPL